MAKKHSRHAAPPRQTRTRTRRDKGAALVSDPIENTQQLNEQLRALGLYPAPTLGDGNCLFRALADQYYGSPSQHLMLREEICDWIQGHKQRYEPFVLDERGLDVHLRCMRQQGTYGGHLELTAFAHLKKRDVKVIQPGLVYVIDWRSGGDMSPTSPKSPSLPASPEVVNNERDVRRMRREKKKDLKDKTVKAKQAVKDVDEAEDENEDEAELGAVYVAYHDWEHFSSVRNLTGPHSGLPYVVEKPISSSQAGNRQKHGNKPVSSESSQSSLLSSSMDYDGEEVDEEDASPEDPPPTTEQDDGFSPEGIPLPHSRSSSPSPTSEASASGSSSLSVPLLPGYNCPPNREEAKQLRRLSLRINRSPKRAYDVAEETAEDSQGEAKRSRRVLRLRNRGITLAKEDVDIDDADTPDLTSSGDSGSASSSPAATPPPSMVVVPPSPITPAKPLTRRQRKALGLPKARSVSASASPAPSRKTRSGAGKIVVPGGRFKKPVSASADARSNCADEDEWERNGTGRVDVRGFKELRI